MGVKRNKHALPAIGCRQAIKFIYKQAVAQMHPIERAERYHGMV